MSPVTDSDPTLLDEELQYRSIHTMAVLGLLLGVLSIAMVVTAGFSIETTLELAPIPLLGLAVSLVAWRAIHREPDRYTGLGLAIGGAALSTLCFAGGVGYGWYVYATEAPDGYARTSFLEMKPTEADLAAGDWVPPKVKGHIQAGAPVFLKGYIRPDSVPYTKNIREFLLVRDNQQCCFGDLSKVQFFDQVRVSLGPGLKTDFSRGLFRVGGKLTIGPPDRELGTPITYHLDADYVR